MMKRSNWSRSANIASFKIAGIYLILEALWIIFSDQAVGLLTLDLNLPRKAGCEALVEIKADHTLKLSR